MDRRVSCVESFGSSTVIAGLVGDSQDCSDQISIVARSYHSEVKTEGPLPTGAENLTPVTKKLSPMKKEKTPLRALLISKYYK